MFNMSRQNTRRQIRLNELMESRILGNGYVRFGGEYRETFYSNIEIGARCLAYFLTTSHDGYGSITAAFTPVRVVCQNTLNAAFKNCSNAVKIRHTANAKERLEQAHKVMGISYKLSEFLESAFNQWSKVRITDKQVRKLIQLAMVPNKEALQNIRSEKQDELSTAYKNMCDTVYEYGLSSPTQQTETTKGTVFGAYNSITGYFQNVRIYKDSEAKLKSLLYGGTAQLRTVRAFHLCESFASKGEIALGLN